MQLMDSHIEAGQDLSDKDKKDYYAAMIEYLYYGREPSLKGPAKAVFTAIKPILDNSRMRAEAGRNGGSKTPKEPKAKRKQTRSKPVSKTEANAKQNTDFDGSYQDSPSPSSYSSSSSSFIPDSSEIPTLQEVKEHFETNFLNGDPELFFATYDAKGWIDGSGFEITNWRSQALKWSRMQASRNAEKLARGEPTPEEAKWVPASQAEDAEYERAMQEYADVVGEEKARKWREEHES